MIWRIDDFDGRILADDFFWMDGDGWMAIRVQAIGLGWIWGDWRGYLFQRGLIEFMGGGNLNVEKFGISDDGGIGCEGGMMGFRGG